MSSHAHSPGIALFYFVTPPLAPWATFFSRDAAAGELGVKG